MRIDELSPQQVFHILSKAALEGLGAGDLVQGRVTAMENGLLLVTLLDGSSFSASLPEGLDVPLGALLTLQLGEPAGDQLTARIVRMDIPPKQEAAVDSLASQAARQLQSLGARDAGALVSRVLDLIGENPGLGIKEAAFLAANRMESDKAMVEMAVKLANREFNVNDNLQALGRLIGDTLSSADRAALESVLKPVLFWQEAYQAAKNLAARLDNGAPGEGTAPGKGSEPVLARKLADALENIVTGREPPGMELVYDAARNALSAHGADRNAPQESPGTGNGKLDELIKDFAEDIIKIADRARGYFEKESPDVRKIIGSILEKAYVRVEDDRIERIDLEEKAEILKKILDLASDTARLAGEKGSQAIRLVVRELADALRFFSQANTYHVFMHVPLMINRHETAGELYIMKRRSRKGRIDPNQFTLFMSLKTQNLGLVETFLNASLRYLTIHFRVESDDLAKYVKAHRKDLYDALEKKGYKLAEMKCRVMEGDPVNPLDAANEAESVLGLNTRVDLRI